HTPGAWRLDPRHRRPAEDTALCKCFDHRRGIARPPNGEFVKEMLVEHRNAANRHELLGERNGACVIEAGEPPQSRLAEQAEMDAESERAHAGAGADVGGGLLAAGRLGPRAERWDGGAR